MGYKIPLFDLNFDDKEEEAVVMVLRSKWISTGPKIKEFEDNFSGRLHVKHALAMTNCTVSLHIALSLVGVSAGDEVICPSLTFVATANAIRYLNAIPVFADVVSHEDLTIDPEDIERKITDKTKAIIVMHYGGFACNMDKIMAIAHKKGLKVVEDTSHGPLAEYKGKKLGTIGDVGCFSFFSNKNISTGEGGMLVMNNSEYYKRAKLLRSHGMTCMSYERARGHSTAYDVVDLGYNYRMDDIRASIGIVQLSKIQNDLKSRVAIRKEYERHLSQNQKIIIPFSNYQDFSTNYIFPILLRNSTYIKRNEIRDRLAERGIQTSVHYPAVHRFRIYKDFYSDLSITDYVADNLITLPMFSNLTNEQILFISKSLNEVV